MSLLLIDEASRVRDEIYRPMRPALVVRDGFFWEEWERGGEEWERISVPATECARISEARDGWFRQEYLCEFVDRDGAVFPRDVIDAAYQDYEGI